MRIILILASLLLLAACKPEDYAVLDQAEGHDPLGNAPKVTLLAISSSVEIASSASSVPPVVEPPVVASSSSSSSSSSSEYVAPEPPKEPCTEGLFRVYFCVDGFRQYI